MKIFFVDKYNKNYDLAKELSKNGFDNIEVKSECKTRTTKNDVIILIDSGEYNGLSRTASVILITSNKDSKFVWKFVNTYNCIDIIDENMDREYIISRLLNKLYGSAPSTTHKGD